MTRRKERTLKELNEVTDKILEPEITPVLKGSFRIQGPVEEADYDIQMNMGSSQDGRRFGRRSQPGKVWSRAESGTCNVCAAPCSSCMHFNRDVSNMGSKTDEFSDETCRGKAASRCSFSDAVNKGRLCDDWQSIVSENSNLLSTSSSHDSFSENAESKATLKAFNASEDIDVLSAEGCVRAKLLSAAGKKTVSNQYEEQKDSECNDDNISCVIGSSEGSMLAGDHYRDADRSNRSNSSVSFSNLLPDGSEMMVPGQTASGSWPKFHCGIGESNDNSGKPCASAKESALKSYNVSLSTANHAKDLEEISCSQCRGEPSECSSEHLESSSARLEISDSFGGKKSAPHICAGSLPKSETSELIVVRNNSSGASTKIYPVLEAEADGCSGDPPNEQVNKSSSSHAVSLQEPALISQPVDESELDDVKVCDICGDAGREELLAICSRCSDGAEHTYCMQIMLDKLPEGDWLCADTVTGDIVFVLQQKEHPKFKRKGDDLFYEHTLSLTEALCGFQFVLTHLDNRQLLIKSHPGEVVKPDQFKGINDEGMPMYQRPFMRGKLYIHFTVEFPDSLTMEQCKALEAVLPPRTSMQLTDMEIDECEETTLHDVNIEEEMRRKQAQAQEAYEEDEDGHGGAQRVQCAQQ